MSKTSAQAIWGMLTRERMLWLYCATIVVIFAYIYFRTPSVEAYKSAIGHGDVEEIEAQLSKGIDPDTEVAGAPGIRHALALGNSDMVRVYLEHGARLDHANSRPSNLLLALDLDDPELINEIFNSGNLGNMAAKIGDRDKHSLFHEVIYRFNDLESIFPKLIPRLVAIGANINHRDRSGRSPLNLSIERNCLPCIHALVESGADVNGIYRGKSLLYEVVLKRRRDLIEYLVDQGLNINNQEQYAYNHPLYLSLKHESGLDELLLQLGADPDFRGSSPKSMLAYSISAQDGERVPLKLIEYGAKPKKGWEGTELLRAALKAREFPVVRALVQAGVEPENNMYNIWDDSVAWGNIEVLDILGDAGLPWVSERSTVLHSAATKNKPEVISYFIRKGLDANGLDEQGYTPLHLAAQWGSRDAATRLLHEGANQQTLTKHGLSPLAVAISHRKPAVASALIEAGSNTSLRVQGFTLLQLLAVKHERSQMYDRMDTKHSKQLECASILLDNGADVNAVSVQGHTAWQISKKNGYDSLANLLVERGYRPESAQ